jgi:hypothetical protein
MSPRRPRRRARRRSPARPIILLIAVVIGLALLVGGLTQVSRQSQGYDANTNRSLAAQGSVVALQSNRTASQVRSLVSNLQAETRQSVGSGLDGAVEQTANQAARVDLAVGSSPSGSAGAELATVFTERAQSVAELRSAIDGFLGMQPLPTADAPATASPSTAATTSPSVQLTAAQATNQIAAAGALLARSDDLYRSVQRSLANTTGHARIPKSVWVTDPQLWQAGTVATQVDLMATSPTLAESHYLLLRTVRLNPPALPTPPGAPATVSNLSPTTQIEVTAVLGNNGTANEPHAAVRFTLANQATGASAVQLESAALSLGASTTLPTVTFTVKPGSAYVLTVAVVLPPGQAATAGTALQQALQVAPAT